MSAPRPGPRPCPRHGMSPWVRTKARPWAKARPCATRDVQSRLRRCRAAKGGDAALASRVRISTVCGREWRSHSVRLGSAPRRFCGLSVSLGRVSASLGREHRRRWQSGHLQRGRWLAVPLIFTPDRDGAPLCRGACACVTCWHDRPSRRPSSNAPSPDDAHRLASLSQKAALSPKLHCRKKSFNYANKY